jgi:hypothetical protein
MIMSRVDLLILPTDGAISMSQILVRTETDG